MNFEKIDSKVIFQGHIMDLVVDQIRFENGIEAQREVAKHLSAAAIVPVTPEGKIIMVRQYRYAVEEDTLEIPAGLLDPGEDPLEGARRELEEEIGQKPLRMEHMFRFYSSPGFTTEVLDCYLCEEMSPSKQHLDVDEFIDIVEVTPEEAMQMISDGRIADGKTVAAISFYVAKKTGGTSI